MQAESPLDSLSKLSATVLDALRSSGETLAVAESCTGGLLSAALTSVARASTCFLGAWVVYSPEAKRLLGVPADLLEEKGAVSEACTRHLARLAAEKLQASYALSLTGLAGPSGDCKHHGVGTCFIGLYQHGNVWVKHFHLRGPRVRFQKEAASLALQLLKAQI